MSADPIDDSVGDHHAAVYNPEQIRYDRQPIHAVIDEALICHVAYVHSDGTPIMIPTIHARIDDTLYLHTATGSRLAQLAEGGTPLCVTVSLLDGLVLARSQVNHSVNHRSVIIRGEGVLVTGDDERRTALAAVVEHLVAGRSRHSRPPTADELAATRLVRLPLVDVALRSRTGPPMDDDGDLPLHHWAGVIGIRNGYGPAFPAPDLPYDRPVPAQLANYSRSARPQSYR